MFVVKRKVIVIVVSFVLKVRMRVPDQVIDCFSEAQLAFEVLVLKRVVLSKKE